MSSLYMKGSDHWAEHGEPMRRTLSLTPAQRKVLDAAVADLRQRHGARPDGKPTPRAVCLDYMALETSGVQELSDGIAAQPGEATEEWWYRQYPEQEELIATMVAKYQMSHPDAQKEEAVTSMAATYMASTSAQKEPE